MDNKRTSNLIAILEEIENDNNKQVNTKLEIDKSKRIVQRLASFSTDCDTCKRSFTELEEHILQLRNKKLTLKETNNYKQKLKSISTHLQKQHKLLPQGHYLGIYMSLGVSIGVVFGLTIFDNIALGIPIGIGMGIAIGTGLDADAKKKGQTL